MQICRVHGAMVEENGRQVCLVCSQARPNIISEVTRPSTEAEIAEMAQVPRSGMSLGLIAKAKTEMAERRVFSGPTVVQDIIEGIERLTMPSDLKKCKTILKLKQLAQSLLED